MSFNLRAQQVVWVTPCSWGQSKRSVLGHGLCSEPVFWDCDGNTSLLSFRTCCGYSHSFLRHNSPWTRDHSFHQEDPVALRGQASDEPGLHFGLNVFHMGECKYMGSSSSVMRSWGFAKQEIQNKKAVTPNHGRQMGCYSSQIAAVPVSVPT